VLLTIPGLWRVSRAWLERAREVALRDLAQTRNDAALLIGAMALETLRRPRRFPSALKALWAADRVSAPTRRPYAPVHPGVPQLAEPSSEATDTPTLRADIRALREETAALDGSSAARLGRRLLRLRARPWRLPLLPLVVLHHVMRRAGAVDPRPAALPASRPPIVTRSMPARPRWSCLAPAWLGEMLAFEGVAALDVPAAADRSPDALLVCLAARSDVTLAKLAAWRRDSAAASAACPVVFWLLDGAEDPAWTRHLSDNDRVYVSDAHRVGELTERLGRSVKHLPLAVQPLLHNPIEWWNGDRGIEARHQDDGDVPSMLRTLVALARGGDVEESALRALPDHLGAPLPAPNAPAWADAGLRRDLVRHARLRRVLRDETVGARLERMALELGLTAGGNAPPLVTVITSTIRPHRLAEVARSFAAQTYPRKELVLVLHGPGFVQREVDAIVGEVDAPVRVHRAPDPWTLGQCLQLGCDESDGRFVCIMDDDNVYGPRYVEDYVLAMGFSEAGLLGKASHVIRFEELDRMYLYNPGLEYRYVKVAGGGRFMLRREILDQVRWRPMPVMEDLAFSEDCESLGVPMLSADRFHFVRVRGKPGEHTARMAPSFFFARNATQLLPRDVTAEDLQS